MVHEQGFIVIERPVNVVFDFLLDGLNNPLWRTSVTDIQAVPGKANTFKQGMKGPGGRVDGDYEVTEVRANELIALKTIAGMVRPTGSYATEAVGDATRVTYTLHFEGKGPARMMDPIVQMVMRAEIGMLPNLKNYLEQNQH